MRYHLLASDYDGTLAHDGRVDSASIESLKALLATGRRLVLVTGRELPELLEILPEIDLFEWVVAENGGLLYRPSTKEEKPLADPPRQELIDALTARGVAPMSVGRIIVATWEPHQNAVLEVIREQGLDLQVIFNKGAVMILPAGVNKASGLKAALREMQLSPHNVVAIGDAENDHALLRFSELGAAVANALPAVKATADLVTDGDHGKGVAQLIERLVATDLAELDPALARHHLRLGMAGEQAVALSPYGRSVLICGPSASGKSTVATRIMESLIEQSYQFCLIDPEGDYELFEGAMVFGGPKAKPSQEEIRRLLETPGSNAVACLTGVPIPDRPGFFLSLLAELLEMRSAWGRPHWLVLDEAHHLMPAEWRAPEGILPEHLDNVMLITVHPDLLSRSLLERITTILVVGENAHVLLQDLAEILDEKLPPVDAGPLQQGEVLLWRRDRSEAPVKVKVDACKMERQRHSRKYAEGELPPDRSFWFRGPDDKLNLRAQNLILFLQMADGVDDETWEHHLRNGDYSRWFRESIKDETLAASAARVENLHNLTARESRELIRAEVERDYTLPAAGALPVPGAS